MIGWHATRNAKAILMDGKIKPTRLPCIYLFSSKLSALYYAKEFKYDAVVIVDYEAFDVDSVWTPRYANGANVIRLKPGRIAILRDVHCVHDVMLDQVCADCEFDARYDGAVEGEEAGDG